MPLLIHSLCQPGSTSGPVKGVHPIWQATDRTEVHRRRAAFRATWTASEPEVVAALDRVFPATLADVEALARARERDEVWAARHLRTTSALERVNRALRHKARQVGVFHAERGLLAAIALIFTHRGLGLDAPSDDLWTEVLEAGLVTP